MKPIKFHSKIAGVTATNVDGVSRQQLIVRHCREGTRLRLCRESDNPHDSNAVGVWIEVRYFLFFTKRVQLGYLNRDVAKQIGREMDSGRRINAVVAGINGDLSADEQLGVNILLYT